MTALTFFDAHHRAQAAAAGVAAVVGDRGVAHDPLPGRPDRGDPPGRAHPRRAAAPRPPPPAGPTGRRRGSSDTPLPSIKSTDGRRSAPRSTIASWPVSLPAMAKWLEASASVNRPVSGDLATTANLALVVNGVPTNGEKTNISGARGERIDARRAGRCISQVPSPAPPMNARSTDSSIGARPGSRRCPDRRSALCRNSRQVEAVA